jgi:predicted ester cyclase
MRRLLSLLTLLLVVGLTLPTVPIFAHGDTQAHKDIVMKALDEIFAKGNLDYLSEIASADYQQINPSGMYNLAGVQLVVGGFKAAMPDFKATPLIIIAEGDWVAARVVYSGTFTNPLQLPTQKIEPNNKLIMWTANGLTHFNADDKIDMDWLQYDNLSVFTQLGIIPPQADMPAMTEMKLPEFTALMPLPEDIVAGNKQGIMDVFEMGFNKGDYSNFDKHFATDFVSHEEGRPDSDLTAFTELIKVQRAAVPDLKATVDAVLCEGNYCAFRASFAGTFKHDLTLGPLTLKATGKPVAYAVQVFIRTNDKGVTVEQWIASDTLNFLTQFGAL